MRMNSKGSGAQTNRQIHGTDGRPAARVLDASSACGDDAAVAWHGRCGDHR